MEYKIVFLKEDGINFEFEVASIEAAVEFLPTLESVIKALNPIEIQIKKNNED